MRPRGYILVETIVAMAVLSVTIMGIHRSVQQALIARGIAQDYTTARFLLEEKVAELTIQPQLRESQGKGVFPAPYQRFNFEWKVSKISFPKPPMPPHLPPERRPFIENQFKDYMGRITLKLDWTRAGRPYERVAETLISPDKLWQPPKPRPQ